MNANPENEAPAYLALKSRFEAYETALVGDDAKAINGFFWNSTDTIRFGIADYEFGYDEIVKWRTQHWSIAPGRTLINTKIMVLSDSVGVVTTQFKYPDREILGLQTQVWKRFENGSWLVVSAHVSEIKNPQ